MQIKVVAIGVMCDLDSVSLPFRVVSLFVCFFVVHVCICHFETGGAGFLFCTSILILWFLI